MRRSLILPFFLAVGCATPPGPGSPDTPAPPGALGWPDGDQVCSTDPGPFWATEVPMVLDTAGLRADLEPLIPIARTGEDAPAIEIGVNHYPDLDPVSTSIHVARSELDSLTSERVRDRVRVAFRPRGLLARPLRLRIRIERTPFLRLRTLPAEYCAPHVAHTPSEPPDFGGGVRVSEGVLRFRLDDPQVIGVRLHIDGDGTLVRVDFQAGNRALLDAVERALSRVRFNPALLGNERVAGELELVFRFDMSGRPARG